MAITQREKRSRHRGRWAGYGHKTEEPPKRSLLQKLGPGLTTGASDDDPSGIATYSQVGAQLGYGIAWTMLFSYPLMAAVQEISGRVGRITGRGLAGNIRRHYPKWLLYPTVLLVLIANTINLGADIGAMGAAAKLLVGGNALVYCAAFALIALLAEVFLPYAPYARVLKWMSVSLFAYAGTVFVVHVPWREALHGTFVPDISFHSGYVVAFVAVLGTTISPYLFFWQAAQESEEVQTKAEEEPLLVAPEQARGELDRIRWDTYAGMFFSNVTSWFIILAAAATLHAHGVTDIQTSSQAAEALRPIAGRFAFLLFAGGIVGTGLLAVPVLAGSAAYAVGEALHWPVGLDRKPLDARGFYGILSVATLIGLALNFTTRIDPIKALFWTAVINGVVAVPVMVVMMLMIHNEKVVGKFALVGRRLRIIGWLATAVMLLAVVAMFATWGKG